MQKRKINIDKDKLAIAFEIPISVIEMFSNMIDYDFVIAPIFLKCKDYANFYIKQRERGRYIILDNGAFEGELVAAEDMIDIMHQIQPDEIVAPDVPGDAENTKKVAHEFLDRFSKHSFFGKVNIQATPQGKTFPEFIDCYKYFSELDIVDVIGISYYFFPEPKFRAKKPNLQECFDVTSNDEAKRLYFFHLLMSRGLLADKPHHLLGLGNPRALRFYKLYPFMRSIDTSFPVITGYEGNILHYDTEKPKTRLDYTIKFDDKQIVDTTANVSKFKSICQD